MGQAKKRGDKNQRIVQALERETKLFAERTEGSAFFGSTSSTKIKPEQQEISKTPPVVGMYMATKLDEGMEVSVSEVTEPEEDGFYMVYMSTDNDLGWPDAIETELINKEWIEFSNRYGLIPSPYDV